MEKTITLEAKEKQVLGGLEMEHLRLNARYGMLCREKEDLDKKIATSEEQQRSFIRDVVFHRGIEGNYSARLLDNSTVVCSLPDEPMVSSPPVAATVRPNGVAEAA